MMNQDGTSSSPLGEPQESSSSGCFFTVFRMLVGPGLILATGAALIVNKARPGSVWDFIFLSAVAATIGAALLSTRKPPSASPQPGEIQPMSRSRYFLIVLGAAGAFYGFAHFVAPRIF